MDQSEQGNPLLIIALLVLGGATLIGIIYFVYLILSIHSGQI